MEGLEVFCSSAGENNHLSSCERKSQRAARKRRMEIRRFKVMATSVAEPGVAPPPSKRIKLADSKFNDVVARDCFNAVDSNTSALAVEIREIQVETVSSKSDDEVAENEGFVLKANVTTGHAGEALQACRRSFSCNEFGCLEYGGRSFSRDGFGCPEYGVVSICGRRREMEDAVSILLDFNSKKKSSALHFFGVYDGHGGPQAAALCKDRLHELLAEELNCCGVMQTESEWQKAMSSCFNRVDAEVLSGGTCRNDCKTEGKIECCCEQTIASETVGTTAVVTIVGSQQIVVANCGDSRAVLSRDGVAIPLSVDHKPDRPDEMSRIESAGGRVIFWNGPRVFGVLAMSRAIGDKYLKPYVISEPEVTITEQTDGDECLVLASDGLWDVMSNDVVCELARKCLSGRFPGGGTRTLSKDGDVEESPSTAAAALLTKLALARGSIDNISIVVVDLKGYRKRT